ncbi:MAG: CDP-alcohol phosphatidyltransferase family protein [Dehalococcoidia bacterium]|nr:CDP-alcohol phosphatidyltransferase family protein [Dehalococcoidia bacterium]
MINPNSIVSNIRDAGRKLLGKIITPVIDGMIALRIRPAMITVAGLIGCIPAMILVAQGNLLLGGVIFFLSSLLDLFDGALARKSNSSSDRGALLDSVADRISEALIMAGILYLGWSIQDKSIVLFSFGAVVGSLLVSYIRARAEGLGLELNDGWFTRPERIILISGLLVFNLVSQGLILLTVLTFFTALQRWKLADEKLKMINEKS